MLPTQEQQKIQVAKAHVKCNREQSAQKKKNVCTGQDYKLILY